ncbi:MAG: uroporphyrinogen-III synthase [Pseudomonadota bacterium]
MEEHAKPVVLLTRPSEASARFACALSGDRAEVVISPLQSIVRLPFCPAVESELIFTSENGARIYGDTVAGDGTRAWCVGERTAAVAAERGYVPAVGGGTAEDLLAKIIAEKPELPLVWAAGRNRRVDIVAGLQAAGLRAELSEVYDQVPAPLSDEARRALVSGRPVVAPVFSPRSASLLADTMPEGSAPIVVCISRAAAEAAPLCATVVAEAPNASAVAASVNAVLAQVEGPRDAR